MYVFYQKNNNIFLYKMYNLEYYRKWSKTPSGRKSQILKTWKYKGILGDLSFIYDTHYLPATECWVCNKEFKTTKNKHCDHDHDTGEFRQVLCCACNTRDSWKKYF